MTDVTVFACPYCRFDTPAEAVVCGHCRATRRKPGSKWRSHRDGLRNDIALGITTSLVILWITLGILTVLLLGRTSVTPNRSTTSCTYTNPSYPYC